MTKVLAIDPSTTCLGWAVLEKDGKDIKAISYGFCDSKGAKHYQRIPTIICRLLDVLGLHIKAIQDFSVVIEDITKVAHKSKAAAICAGAIDWELRRHFNVLDVVAPKTAKKIVTGNGNASKEDVQKAVTKLIKGVDFYPQTDAADALAIGYTYLMGVK